MEYYSDIINKTIFPLVSVTVSKARSHKKISNSLCQCEVEATTDICSTE